MAFRSTLCTGLGSGLRSSESATQTSGYINGQAASSKNSGRIGHRFVEAWHDLTQWLTNTFAALIPTSLFSRSCTLVQPDNNNLLRQDSAGSTTDSINSETLNPEQYMDELEDRIDELKQQLMDANIQMSKLENAHMEREEGLSNMIGSLCDELAASLAEAKDPQPRLALIRQAVETQNALRREHHEQLSGRIDTIENQISRLKADHQDTSGYEQQLQQLTTARDSQAERLTDIEQHQSQWLARLTQEFTA
ncbi:hypothetical protein [Parendozoicomonas haliclonae]|uniref:Chromosome partition protein Smc n=1 Tax=Parendozoicomonas haliclonae TaxID=1960125 RepID=A0A1X7AMZ8_9GAMM|nr:hypothetical protein [Parendozoicomonas haliclonae]SMA49402.1 Chromosome partition protein Smc [Parendozoicomonas haliclonae]